MMRVIVRQLPDKDIQALVSGWRDVVRFPIGTTACRGVELMQHGSYGDYLVIAESWRYERVLVGAQGTVWARVQFKADNGRWWVLPDCPEQAQVQESWQPADTMPVSARRLIYVIVRVDYMRLREITPEDCRREGITGKSNTLRNKFMLRWNVAHSGDHSWKSNPWVARLELVEADMVERYRLLQLDNYMLRQG